MGSVLTVFGSSNCQKCKTLLQYLEYKEYDHDYVLIDDDPEKQKYLEDLAGVKSLPFVMNTFGSFSLDCNPKSIDWLVNMKEA